MKFVNVRFSNRAQRFASTRSAELTLTVMGVFKFKPLCHMYGKEMQLASHYLDADDPTASRARHQETIPAIIITRQTLYRHVAPKGEIRPDGEKLLAQRAAR